MKCGETTIVEAPNPGEGTGRDMGSTSPNLPGPQVRADSLQANDVLEQETAKGITGELDQTSSCQIHVASQPSGLTAKAAVMAKDPEKGGFSHSVQSGTSGEKRALELLTELEVLTVEEGGTPKKRKLCSENRGDAVIVTSTVVVDNKSASPEEKYLSQTILVLSGTCIEYSTDKLIFRRDNLVNFISSNLLMTTAISKALMNEGIVNIELLKETKKTNKLNVSMIVTMTQYRRKIFNAIIKPAFDSKPLLVDVEKAILKILKLLKITTDAQGIKSFSVSRNGVGLDRLPWSSIEKLFKQHSDNDGYKITICSNEVRVPLEENIPSINY